MSTGSITAQLRRLHTDRDAGPVLLGHGYLRAVWIEVATRCPLPLLSRAGEAASRLALQSDSQVRRSKGAFGLLNSGILVFG